MAVVTVAAEPGVPYVTGCSKEGLLGFPLHITRRARQILDNILFERIHPETVLAFIHAIEKAEQYFAAKDLVREMLIVKEQKCVADDVMVDTAKALENDERFDKLGHEEIVHALNAVNFEVQPRNASLNPRGKTPNPDHVAVTLEERLDLYLDIHPVCHLVFETRTKDRILDVDPTVELKKLMRTASFLDYGLFDICDRRFKEKTLTFSGDTLDKEEIKAKLSKCGKIEHVKLKSLKKLAHVTFRDLAGADEAVLLAIQGVLDLGGKPADLILTSSNLLRYCFPPGIMQLDEDPNETYPGLRACLSEFLQKARPDIQAAAEESVEEVLNELLSDALCRYILFIEGQAKGKAKRRNDERAKMHAR